MYLDWHPIVVVLCIQTDDRIQHLLQNMKYLSHCNEVLEIYGLWIYYFSYVVLFIYAFYFYVTANFFLFIDIDVVLDNDAFIDNNFLITNYNNDK